MIYSPQDLLGTTESLLKYDEDTAGARPRPSTSTTLSGGR